MTKDEILEELRGIMNNPGGFPGVVAFHAIELIEEQDSVEHALDILRANGWKEERCIKEG
jgi:hypothetical protein